MHIFLFFLLLYYYYYLKQFLNLNIFDHIFPSPIDIQILSPSLPT